MNKITPTGHKYLKMLFSTGGILEEYENPNYRITMTREGQKIWN